MLFKDPKYQAALEKDGFTVIPFLNNTEVAELNAVYSGMHGDGNPPDFYDNIHMTTWCSDESYKKSVAEKLEATFKNASDAFFQRYRTLNNVFIVKKSGPATTFKVHQDWSVVDERKYQSVNVWVPLHDVDQSSGALWVLKGSHKIDRRVRGAGYLFPDYGPFYDQLMKKAVSVKLKAGEAVVFYHSVIHGSPPNLAPGNRKAACFTVIPENAPLCIYFQANAESPLEQHEPDDNFVYKYNYLRSQSLVAGPTQRPVSILPPYVNKKVELSELKFFLKPRHGLLAFWRKIINN